MIYINVVNQRLCMASLADVFVSGSQQFVKFKFNLCKDWDGLSPFAQFRQEDRSYNQYLDKDNCVFLPAEIKAGTCTLMLYGSGHKTIATTNYLTLKINKDNFVSDASSTEISQSLYDQLLEKVSDEALQKRIEDTFGDTLEETVSDELRKYIESGKIGELAIADGTLSIKKIDDNFKKIIDDKLDKPADIIDSLSVAAYDPSSDQTKGFKVDDESLSDKKTTLPTSFVVKSEIDKKNDIFQWTEMPEASEQYKDTVVQYMGPTTTKYKHGMFYYCQNQLINYVWAQATVSAPDNNKLDKPDTLSTAKKLITYSLGGTGVSEIETNIANPTSTSNSSFPTTAAVKEYVDDKLEIKDKSIAISKIDDDFLDTIDGKIDKVNGQGKGTLEIYAPPSNGSNQPNSITDGSNGVITTGRNLKINGNQSFIAGVGNDIGNDSGRKPAYVITSGQGNRLLRNYSVVNAMGAYDDGGANLISGYGIISNGNYSIIDGVSIDTKIGIGKNTLTIIDSSANNFDPNSAEDFRVEVTPEKLTEIKNRGKLLDVMHYNGVVFNSTSGNLIVGADNQSAGYQSMIIGSDNIIPNYVHFATICGERNCIDSGGVYSAIFGNDDYTNGRVFLFGERLKVKNKQVEPGMFIGTANAPRDYATYLTVGNGKLLAFNNRTYIPDYQTKSFGAKEDYYLLPDGYSFTISTSALPSIASAANRTLYKELVSTGVYSLKSGYGYGSSGTGWIKLSEYALLGYMVDKLPASGDPNVVYYKNVDSSTLEVFVYNDSKWCYIDRIVSIVDSFAPYYWVAEDAHNALEVRVSDGVTAFDPLPELIRVEELPTPVKDNQLVHKKYVDDLVAGGTGSIAITDDRVDSVVDSSFVAIFGE